MRGRLKPNDVSIPPDFFTRLVDVCRVWGDHIELDCDGRDAIVAHIAALPGWLPELGEVVTQKRRHKPLARELSIRIAGAILGVSKSGVEAGLKRERAHVTAMKRLSVW